MHPDLLNKNLRDAQYAVRGELYLRAMELTKEGKEITFTNGETLAANCVLRGGASTPPLAPSNPRPSHAYNSLLSLAPSLLPPQPRPTVGNPHQLGQKPMTFFRQVLSLCHAPFLLQHPKVGELFPADAIARAKDVLKKIGGGGLGAYSDSRGYPWLRQEIADYIQRRDGHPSNPENIFVTDGASVCVRMALNGIIRDERDAILVPIPQYPLYSAAIKLYGGSLVGYFLDEPSGWQLDFKDLKESLYRAREQGKDCRALVFINPGNPTGQCLSRKTLEQLAQFAFEERLVLLADEVYAENIYQDERPFVSMKKVLMEMGGDISKQQELISFHSVSKGPYGECGMRGGYMEMTNVHQGTIDEMYKVRRPESLSPAFLSRF